MKRIFTLILFWTIAAQCLAQIKFEPGTYKDNQGQVHSGFIENMGWLNNPEKIRFKNTESAQVEELDMISMQEFEVGYFSYVRATVQIDTATQNLRELNVSRYPAWDTRELFLKVLVKGKATLFSYRNSSLLKFFFSADTVKTKQLEYKLFAVAGSTAVNENRNYLQQIRNHVTCGDLSADKLMKIKYREHDLVQQFVDYNTCHGETPVIARRRPEYFFALTLGVDRGVLKAVDFKDFPYHFSFRGGLSAEMMLPFNSNKWSLVAEPAFQSYRSGKDVTYQSIEIPAGLRHHFYLNERSRLFVNLQLVLDLPFKYDVHLKGSRFIGPFTVQSYDFHADGKSRNMSFVFGGGYRVGRTSFELRHYFRRRALDHTTSTFFLNYTKTSFTLAYQLHKKAIVKK